MSFRVFDPIANLVSSIYGNVPITNKIVYSSINDGDTLSLTLANTTYIQAFFDNGSGSVSATLNILNQSIVKFGDTLNLIFSRQNTDNSVTINLPENFIYTTCGDLASSISFNSALSIFVPFIYDGSNFVNTFDNC